MYCALAHFCVALKWFCQFANYGTCTLRFMWWSLITGAHKEIAYWVEGQVTEGRQGPLLLGRVSACINHACMFSGFTVRARAVSGERSMVGLWRWEQRREWRHQAQVLKASKTLVHHYPASLMSCFQVILTNSIEKVIKTKQAIIHPQGSLGLKHWLHILGFEEREAGFADLHAAPYFPSLWNAETSWVWRLFYWWCTQGFWALCLHHFLPQRTGVSVCCLLDKSKGSNM